MLRSALPVFLFCLLGRLDCTDLTAKRGANATLECFGSKNASEVMIDWKKNDSKSGINVIVYKDGQIQHHIQDDSFKDRVSLTDPHWMETKDFSVNLTYVIMNDDGIYQCKAGYKRKNITLLNTINLTVKSNRTGITAYSGENVILPCHNPNNDIIKGVRWSRADPEPKHVVLYQEGEFDPEDLHPYFKDRVDLEGRKMKDGDVSLILKDLTVNDTGTYECRVIWKGTRYMKRPDLEADPICIINLSVPPGQRRVPEKDGHVGLIVGLSLVAVVVVGGGVYLCKKPTQRCHSYNHPPDQHDTCLAPCCVLV